MDIKDVIISFFRHTLHIPFENKGILIPVYWLASFLGIAIIFEVLYQSNIRFSGIHHPPFIFFLSLLITGIWTLLTSNDYYKDDYGKKVKVDIENSLFTIQMRYWIYVFIALAIIVAYKARFFQ